MKTSALIFVVFSLCSTYQVLAGSGKAIIPNFSANSATDGKCVYYMSNITPHDLEVSITFYDQNGTVITSGIVYTNFINSNTEIAAGSTGVVVINPTPWKYGYAVIEWNNKSTDDDVLGLVAHGFFDQQDGSDNAEAYYSIPINCGAAF
ncbi:hypothetical protein [Sulfidibacter corallicola]|uniref:CUB domain-containing protein n=1 Tax=Sulfidibacter corallicola TaxID=2818388 RepID=A0A8A4TWE5_SULCO|nr:hypothetical protein [Sulfidibacter corallicola]QTD53498.1 hypothetical protein J3U87_13670 [Sulfidibacter corallicola]